MQLRAEPMDADLPVAEVAASGTLTVPTVQEPQAAAAVQAPKGRESEFARKRAAEDALLVEYEASGKTRVEFAAERRIRIGTIDGMFARARKRR
eukprot:750875-Prymnesium_polylepis.1